MRAWRVWAASVALMTAVVPPVWAQVFNPTTKTFDNGIQVVVVENHRAPIASHMVWYKVGAADETPGKSGIAHFLEHLMFKGTPAVPPGEFSKIVARNGGRDNAFTSSDYTAYFQNIAVDRLELVMKMEADRRRNLTLAEADVKSELEVVKEERRSRTDNDPAALLHERLEAALFLNHPYRRPIIGWPDELNGLTRDDALAFYKRWYAPNNAILIVAGDVEPAQVFALAETYYGPLKPESVPPRIRAEEPPQAGARQVTLADPRVKQPSWTRLYVAPSPGVAMDKVQAAMNAEIARLLRDGVSEDEVRRAKTRLRAEVVYARDSLHTAARVLGEALTTGQGVADVEDWPNRIDAVTAQQVAAAARAVLDDNASATGLLLPARLQEARQ